mmetsp:Transcript_23290/g.64350  ORF Transcript_23290/g.64350 Transcript_23290/m.64350 type:complete len:217 (-) Transcript_23290:1148-1798(-)
MACVAGYQRLLSARLQQLLGSVPRRRQGCRQGRKFAARATSPAHVFTLLLSCLPSKSRSHLPRLGICARDPISPSAFLIPTRCTPCPGTGAADEASICPSWSGPCICTYTPQLRARVYAPGPPTRRRISCGAGGGLARGGGVAAALLHRRQGLCALDWAICSRSCCRCCRWPGGRKPHSCSMPPCCRCWRTHHTFSTTLIITVSIVYTPNLRCSSG